MTGREQQVALMWIESDLVDLTGVLMQSRQLNARPIQIVQNDLAVGGGSCNVGAKLAMRPFYVVDFKANALSSRGGIVLCVVDYSCT